MNDLPLTPPDAQPRIKTARKLGILEILTDLGRLEVRSDWCGIRIELDPTMPPGSIELREVKQSPAEHHAHGSGIIYLGTDPVHEIAQQVVTDSVNDIPGRADRYSVDARLLTRLSEALRKADPEGDEQ